MKKILFVILGFFIVFVLLIIFGVKQKSSVLIDGKTFYVSIANTDEQKAKGLSIYKSLPLDSGMIFPFQNSGYYPFWMKEMKFPIDIIYIQNNKIVEIFEDVPAPLSQDQQLPIYRPGTKANYVLEINAGLSKEFGFKKGDAVKINL